MGYFLRSTGVASHDVHLVQEQRANFISFQSHSAAIQQIIKQN